MPFLFINSTESQPMDLNSKEPESKARNENATTEISPFKTVFVSNNVLIIVCLTMATMFIIALCAFFYSCFLRRRVLQKRKIVGDEPNAPSRQQLQEAYDFQRMAMLAPQKKVGDLSNSSSFRASLSRWASMKKLPALHSSEPTIMKKDKQPSHYATTPRSVFPTLSRKWSENNAKRIEHLRTKLVARFPSSSSHSTSDISVFFSTSSRNSEWGECSQLSSGDENDVTDAGKKSNSFTKRIPSIVIEFVK